MINKPPWFFSGFIHNSYSAFQHLYFQFLLCNLYIAIIYDIYRKIKEVQPISCILWRVPWNKK
ncbi:hypothetical protein CBFG_04162 [Clostridiales bacterium 1_7_47FAA]|nr:hypothetical protein CBFG_04162 [Clostridiales bacterium 1_7_47FAA]